ncbi:MAG TPA: hypothetical protein VMF66_02070 [Candidatus Acidoferrum sp.]|nr:hypothetical protein [Candidatus Acidoferrum sp.]
MERDYDIFEQLADGAVLWRELVSGHENAVARLKELAQLTSNEMFLFHSPTQTVIARINVPSGKPVGSSTSG